MTPLYYRGASFALIIFAVDDRQSFDEIGWWKQRLTDALSTPISVIVVGNKVDLEDGRVVLESEGSMKAKEVEAQYIEVSAKTGAGIDALFELMVDTLKMNMHKLAKVQRSSFVTPEPAEKICC
jgi:GTPase SAR1 family protein